MRRGRGMMRAWPAWRLLMCRRLRDIEVKSWWEGMVVMVGSSVELSRSRCVHVKEC